MLDIVVCYKMTPDPEDIEVLPDRTISLERAEWKIGEYDLVAVEAGMQIAEVVGGTVSAMSVGPSQVRGSKVKKAILSRGPNDLYLVVGDELFDIDTHLTAKILAAAIRKRGNFDLVLCGEGSSDYYAQQVGLQLGELLGLPTTNAVEKIDVSNGNLLVERTLEDETQILEIPLPAVLSVTSGMHLPRIPSMKDILNAAKKPVTEWQFSDVCTGDGFSKSIEAISTLAPEQVERKRMILEGDVDKLCRELISALRIEGVF
jgi:electron transfer flavoprotein beta subunit